MAATRIEKLTPEQEELLIVRREEWLRIGSSGPSDRPRAEAAIAAMYSKIGEAPPVFLWLDSPLSAALTVGLLGSLKPVPVETPAEEPKPKKRGRKKKATAGAVDDPLESQLRSQLWSQLRSQLESQLWSQLRSQLWSQLRSQLGSQLRSQLESQLRSQLWSQLWSQLESQLRSQLESQLRSQLWSQLWSQLESQLWSQLWSQLESQLWSQLWSQLRSQLWSQLGSDPKMQERAQKSLYEYFAVQQWCGWLAFYTFGREIGVKYSDEDSARLDLWCEAAKSCGWFWPYKGLCIVSERPEFVGWENGRLHCATGPSVSFKDGFRLWHWRGTQVPEAWITAPDKLDPVKALNWENVEQRRCAAEIIGWTRILATLPHKVIDADKSPYIGTLIEVDLPDSPGERFLKVRCGTGRDFVLPVPPDTKTALGGNAWTYGLKPHEYQLEART
jgi:hypothetical protein